MGENEVMRNIRQRISNRRKELGLSYQSLSDKTGISRSTLQRYETGSIKNMPLDKLEVLAKGLCVAPSYLMDWDLENQDFNFRFDTEVDTSIGFVRLPVLDNITNVDNILNWKNIKGYDYISTSELSTTKEYFFYLADDDSMKDSGILPNDKVLIAIQADIEDGDIALVKLDKEKIFLNRIIKQKNTIILKSENAASGLIILSENETDRMTIIGKAVLSIHHF